MRTPSSRNKKMEIDIDNETLPVRGCWSRNDDVSISDLPLHETDFHLFLLCCSHFLSVSNGKDQEGPSSSSR
jgi:hypothetical protein